jgi:hypothetical protein
MKTHVLPLLSFALLTCGSVAQAYAGEPPTSVTAPRPSAITPARLGVHEIVSCNATLNRFYGFGEIEVAVVVRRTPTSRLEVLTGTYEPGTDTFTPNNHANGLNRNGFSTYSAAMTWDMLGLLYQDEGLGALLATRPDRTSPFGQPFPVPGLPFGFEFGVGHDGTRDVVFFPTIQNGGITVGDLVRSPPVRITNLRTAARSTGQPSHLLMPTPIASPATGRTVMLTYTESVTGDLRVQPDPWQPGTNFRLRPAGNDWFGGGFNIGGRWLFARGGATPLPPIELNVAALGSASVPASGGPVTIPVLAPPLPPPSSPQLALLALGRLGTAGTGFPFLLGNLGLDPSSVVTLPAFPIDRIGGIGTLSVTTSAQPPVTIDVQAFVANPTTLQLNATNTATLTVR